MLGHAAFVPGWAGRREEMTERVSAARAYARRGDAPGLFHAWLDAVEAECLTRCADATSALAVLRRQKAGRGQAEPLPAWMDWFTPTRLAAFTGNTELAAGRVGRARAHPDPRPGRPPPHDVKQRSVILADLAAVEVAAEDVAAACARAVEALDALADLWYATGMERIRQVRRSLRPWQNHDCVRRSRRTPLRLGDLAQRDVAAEVGEETRQLGQAVETRGRDRAASGSCCWITAHGPRRIRAVRRPAAAAGLMSLSSRSPT